MSVKEYKCPCCGGNLVFNSDTQKLHCPSCDNEMDMETYQEYAKVVESTEQKKTPTTGEPPTLEEQVNGWSRRMEAGI